MPSPEYLKKLSEIIRKISEYLSIYARQTAENTPRINEKPMNQESAASRLYNAAKASIGKDLSKSAPNEIGCAESCSRVIKMVYSDFPIILSTIGLNLKLRDSYHFTSSPNPIKGCVAIAPTEGGKIGHCWIMGKTWAMSNTSKTGLWSANYLNTDVPKDAAKRGLKIHYYIPV